MEESLTSRDVDFGGSLQHSSLVGATFAINLGYVPRDARCSYFTQGILVGKGSELYNNISPENWCQYPFKIKAGAAGAVGSNRCSRCIGMPGSGIR